MSPNRRRLEGLNPTQRGPDRGAQVPPPPRPAPAVGEQRRIVTGPAAPLQAISADAPLTPTASAPNLLDTKTSKVMTSVPIDLLEQLKKTAEATGKTYTDIVLECVVAHRGELATEHHQDDELEVLQRRLRRVRRDRPRTAQLTLYLTAAERQALDQLAASLQMARSHLVTEALERGLRELA